MYSQSNRLLYENYIKSNEAKNTTLARFMTLGAKTARFEFPEISDWSSISLNFWKKGQPRRYTRIFGNFLQEFLFHLILLLEFWNFSVNGSNFRN